MNKKGIMKTRNNIADVAIDRYEKSKMFLLVLFFMSGLAMIFAGFWAELKLNRFLQFTTKHSYAPSYVLIGTGIIVIFAGFFACCWSSDKGNPVIMYACSVSLFLVVVIEVSAAVAMLVFRKSWIENFDAGMKDAITKYKKFTPYFDTEVDSFQIAVIKMLWGPHIQ
ncbi:tetraspanin-7-like isoform X2 [Agrilus planipennis]|uniref:Tetraspanin-7-like isoform X2 n=1 Tax=Agrilus planipennis TaxID=224129 RepID=A0A7F5RCI4_AGRPL|nr:tetraspanin-7-like isoform X2 [Agrilus planipennis]